MKKNPLVASQRTVNRGQPKEKSKNPGQVQKANDNAQGREKKSNFLGGVGELTLKKPKTWKTKWRPEKKPNPKMDWFQLFDGGKKKTRVGFEVKKKKEKKGPERTRRLENCGKGEKKNREKTTQNTGDQKKRYINQKKRQF